MMCSKNYNDMRFLLTYVLVATMFNRYFPSKKELVTGICTYNLKIVVAELVTVIPMNKMKLRTVNTCYKAI